MAGIEGKHNARKPSKASALREIYNRPLKEGTGLEPTWSQECYRGIPLTEDVARRIREYREYPSLSPADIARMLK